MIDLEARLYGPTLSLGKLLDLREGDVLAFEYPVAKPVDLMVNGKLKYRGGVITTGRKQAFEVQELVVEP